MNIFHLFKTGKQQEAGKLVLLYYVDAGKFCIINRIQAVCVCVCVHTLDIKPLNGNVFSHLGQI